MTKLDLAKQYRSYYTATTSPALVTIAPARFLSLTGQGDPSDEPFALRVQALYATAYAIKFACKQTGSDFTVPKLEGLWWFDEARFGKPSMDEAPKTIPREQWEYRLLIRMPDCVTEAHVAAGIATAHLKNPSAPVQAIEIHEMDEGLCVQMLHIGPFSTEPESLALIAEFAEANGLQQNGVHHEIYLSDFRKTAPEKLKTILREPVRGHAG